MPSEERTETRHYRVSSRSTAENYINNMDADISTRIEAIMLVKNYNKKIKR